MVVPVWLITRRSLVQIQPPPLMEETKRRRDEETIRQRGEWAPRLIANQLTWVQFPPLLLSDCPENGATHYLDL